MWSVEKAKKERWKIGPSVCPCPHPTLQPVFLSANVSLPTPASPPQNRSRITMRYNQQVFIYSPVEQLVLCLFSLLAPSTIPRKLSPPASIKGIFIHSKQYTILFHFWVARILLEYYWQIFHNQLVLFKIWKMQLAMIYFRIICNIKKGKTLNTHVNSPWL